jgi:thiol peroxidase
VETLSAFRNISQFSNDYGVAIEDSSLQGLTSRAVIILNESNEVIYSELVNEITEEPNYDQALSALR